MGNRAVITTAPYKASNVCIYVHWNGGRASVEGFLKAAKELGFRAPPDPYGIARLTQIVTTYLGGPEGLSVGVGLCKEFDDAYCDNGTYLLDGWEIVGRRHHSGPEEVDQAKTDEIAADCVRKALATKD